MTDIIQKLLELLHGFDLVWALIILALATAAWWLIGERVFRQEYRVKWRLLIGILTAIFIGGEILVHHFLLAATYVFPNNVAGILVLRITGDDEHNTLQERLVSSLNAELANETAVHAIEVRGLDRAVDEKALGVNAGHRRARDLGKAYGAQLVLWGTAAGEGGFFPRLTVVNRASASLLRSAEQTLHVQNVRELNLPSAIVSRPIVLARLSAGIVLFTEGDFQGSLNYLNPALRLTDLEATDRAPLLVFAGFDHLYLGASGTVDEQHLRQAIADFADAGVWYKENDLLDRWALTEAWVGEVYGVCALTWLRPEDLDSAIAAHRQAITFFSESNEPELYAEILNNIGILYNQCPTGNYTEHIRAAIPALTTSLRFYAKHGNPVNWATECYNLASAYRDLPTGDSDQNTYEAIKLYRNALLVYGDDRTQPIWAWIQNGLGLAYSSLSGTDDVRTTQQAINYFQAASAVLTERQYPMEWALVQFNMGMAYAGLPPTERGMNTKTAIECFTAGLTVLTKDRSPYWWARLQDNLGDAYASLSRVTSAGDCQKGIEACEQALQVFHETNYPRDWAKVQSHLAWAYLHMESTSILKASSEAVTSYQNALRVFTESDYPDEWASLQTGLSEAYLDLGIVTNRDEYIENSCAAAQAALSHYTETRDRERWAAAQCDLANAYRTLTHGDPIENEKTAFDAYQAALRVYTMDRFPREWALTQINLGLLYFGAHDGDRVDNLLKAAHFLELGLSASSPDDGGQLWAHAQFGLGMTFVELWHAHKSDDYLGMAQASFEQSLRIYTADEYPRMWSSAESALGSLYCLKYIASDVSSNPLDLQLAQEHLERALSVDPSINYKGERESELRIFEVVTNELAKVNITNTVNTQARSPRPNH